MKFIQQTNEGWKLFGKTIKEIRPDIAIHIVYFGIPTYALVTWIQVALGLKQAFWACVGSSITAALFELWQWKYNKGTGSVTDWLASSFVAFVMGCNLIITITKYCGQ